MATSGLKNLLKQFPFFVPRMVHSCKNWIDRKKEKTGDYYSARRDWYKLIEWAGFYTHPLPHSVEPINKKAFNDNTSYRVSESYLFNLKNVFLYRHKGIILSNYNECFQEFTHHFNIQTLRKFLLTHPFYTFSKHYTPIEETAAVLISPESHNYYHWVFDVLPRIKLYGDVLEQVDWFCISSLVPQKFVDLLPAFGISKEKLKIVSDTEKLKFSNLFVGSLPGSEGRSQRWAIDFIREKLLPVDSVSAPSRKIYFKRGDAASRRILNEEVIISILTAEGFDIIEPEDLTMQQQVGISANAQIIISAHGAALTNIAFAQKGNCSVIEIFSPDYFRTDCYYTLSCLLDLNYWYITGSKPVNAVWGDIIIPEESLRTTLAQINNG